MKYASLKSSVHLSTVLSFSSSRGRNILNAILNGYVAANCSNKEKSIREIKKYDVARFNTNKEEKRFKNIEISSHKIKALIDRQRCQSNRRRLLLYDTGANINKSTDKILWYRPRRKRNIEKNTGSNSYR